MSFVPYSPLAMRMLGRNRKQLSPVVLGAAILLFVLPLCLLAGGMAGHDSCQVLGHASGLCSKVVSHADHSLGTPASLITPLSYYETSEVVFRYFASAIPALGLLSISDGRAPPLA